MIIIGQLCTGVLLILYFINYQKEKAIQVYFISKLLYIGVCFYLLFIESQPNFYYAWLGNSSFFIALSLDLNSYLILKGLFNSKIRNYYIIMVSIACLVFYTASTMQARIIYFSIIEIILMIYPIFKLLSEKKASSIQRLVGLSYLFGLGCSAYRGYYTLLFPESITIKTLNAPNVAFYISAYIITTLGSSAFILLSKQKSDKEMNNLASIDFLTGIFNRRVFMEHAEKAMNECILKKEQLNFFMIDIDNFKKINDTYGHSTGDLILKDFAQTIMAQLNSQDLFGRYGGEEFMILSHGNNNEAIEKGNTLRRAIENRIFNSKKQQITYTISIGVVSLIPDENITFEQLLNYGDDALYNAKTQGKNCISIYGHKVEL